MLTDRDDRGDRLLVNGENGHGGGKTNHSLVDTGAADVEGTSDEPFQVEADSYSTLKFPRSQEVVAASKPCSPKGRSSFSCFQENCTKSIYNLNSYQENSRDSLCKDTPFGDSVLPQKNEEPNQDSLKSSLIPDEDEIIVVDDVSFINMKRHPSAPRIVSDAVLSNFFNMDSSSDGLIVPSDYQTTSVDESQLEDLIAEKHSCADIGFSSMACQADGAGDNDERSESQESSSVCQKCEHGTGTVHSSNSGTSYGSYSSGSDSDEALYSGESQDKNSSRAQSPTEDVAQSERSKPFPCTCSAFSPVKHENEKRLSASRTQSLKSGQYITFKMPIRSGKTMPSILVKKTNESDREIKIIFPNEGRCFSVGDNSQTSDKSGLVASDSREVERNVSFRKKLDERSMQSVGTSCNLSVVSQELLNDERFDGVPAVTLNITSTSHAPIRKNAFTLRRDSHDVPILTETFHIKATEEGLEVENWPKVDLFKKIDECDTLAYWSPEEEDSTSAFSEKYVNTNNVYETLRSFCADVDGTLHEVDVPNLYGNDRLFCCRGASSINIFTSLEPLVTSPTDKYLDYPVSFLEVRSRNREGLGGVLECSQNRVCHICSRTKHPKVSTPNMPDRGDKMRRTHPHPHPRMEHRDEQVVYQRAPKGAFMHNNKRPALLFVTRRRETSSCFRDPWRELLREPSRGPMARPRSQKRSATSNASHGKTERDYLRIASSNNKRRLKTSPQKL